MTIWVLNFDAYCSVQVFDSYNTSDILVALGGHEVSDLNVPDSYVPRQSIFFNPVNVELEVRSVRYGLRLNDLLDLVNNVLDFLNFWCLRSFGLRSFFFVLLSRLLGPFLQSFFHLRIVHPVNAWFCIKTLACYVSINVLLESGNKFPS